MKETNRWFRKNGATHLLLDGGALSVKDNELAEFYEAYVRDLYKGEPLYIVEKKTNHFRFFVDLDYTPDDEENLLDFEKVVLEITKIVKLGPCFVAKAKPRKNNTNGKTKYGVHLIWPESVVDKKVANSIRMKLLDEMGSDWEHIIDASVYSGSGLRMIWSLKNEDGSTPYVPWGKVIHENKFEKFEQVFPSVEHLKLFSIRISSESRDVSPPQTSVSNTELEKFIQDNLPGQANAKIVRISKCKNKKDYWISTNSRYCQNVKREHKSNHVWFILKPYTCTISQRCQDDECKKWEGRLYRFPSRLIPNEGSLDTRPHRTINDYLPDGWRERN